ncbi:MAG: efflux RND transporter permease subunit, partial [Rubrivivax sp.]
LMMLFGIVKKNSILQVDYTNTLRGQGMNRHDAIIAANHVRLRPILMTTFALVAGMLPVAIGVGEGGEFYRPMAVAIIGGVITSTLLTLLVVPSFYDSIETSRDRAVAKFKRRDARWPTAVAAGLTGLEALAALTGLRAVWRLLARSGGWFLRRRGPEPA